MNGEQNRARARAVIPMLCQHFLIPWGRDAAVKYEKPVTAQRWIAIAAKKARLRL